MTHAVNEIIFGRHSSSKPTAASERERLLQNPGFGQIYTDHMVTIRWSEDRGGWHDARLEPYGPLRLDPAASVFHYGQEIFEGIKAYRQPGGRIVTFRPDASAARFARSARRLCMPELPESAFIHAIELLVTQDRDWVPMAEDNSLYMRPFMIATEPNIKENHSSSSYLFALIASPVGSYFPRGIHPIRVRLEEEYSRAAPGGVGTAKCGGNYGGAFVAQLRASADGCDMVLWLDSAEHRWLEEFSGMNVFLVSESDSQVSLITPELTGTLLPGITRDSLLKLAQDLGFRTFERRISVDQLQAGAETGEISEMFACGSAAVVTPVGSVKSSTSEWIIGDGGVGRVSMRLRQHLVGIQYGKQPDLHGWIHEIC